MAGTSLGMKLKEMPAQVDRWENWLGRYPNTLVLVKPKLKKSAYRAYHRNPYRLGLFMAPKGESLLPPKTLVFGMSNKRESLAIHLEFLMNNGVLNLTFNDQNIVAFPLSGGKGALVYAAQAQGKALTFALSDLEQPHLLKDLETESLWNWQTGRCIKGPLAGETLSPMAGTPVFWEIWKRYYPETKLHPTEPRSPPH